MNEKKIAPLFIPPSLTRFRQRWSVMSAWQDHIAFGYDIVQALQPDCLVELGTYRGLSYFTFCQSVSDNGLDSICYAVDNWKGDAHVSSQEPYDSAAYETVSRHNREYYHGFSYLLRMQFNDALPTFSDGSIDLLHIDGYHTYEAVSEDYENWFPKVKPGGIILLHDIRARIKPDFGVWRFWEEVTAKERTFSFNHGFGLGVILKQGPFEFESPLIQYLFSEQLGDQEKVRKLYVHACRYLELERRVKRAE